MPNDTSGLRRGPVTPWQKGVSANPNGKISLKNDLKRANTIGMPADLKALLDEYVTNGADLFSELGEEEYFTRFQAAVTAVIERIPPLLEPADARAMWWRMILPVCYAGPQRDKDSNWSYASAEVGTRLLGKPKDTLSVEDGGRTPIDWTRVPEERRGPIGVVLVELHGYLNDPESSTEH